MREYKVAAVVVTYNRLQLLKENVNALLNQSFKLDKMIIVDNASTDGTASWLSGFSQNPLFHIEYLNENIGGAGGFSCGLKLAVTMGYDYCWLMDDDTIPLNDSLQKLMDIAVSDRSAGFVASHVTWRDGSPHQMNKCGILKGFDEEGKMVHFNGTNAYRCSHCSFVSVLISSVVVRKVGLPLKEFFIWCDDLEYTQRIVGHGIPCYYVPSSVVVHKSATNYFPSIDVAPQSFAWRFFYQARNSSYLNRKKKKCMLLFWISVLNKYRLYLRDIKRRKSEDSSDLINAVYKGCLAGLTFNPKIEYIE